eukprot:756007-Hanusia_phi.AAC.2
MQRYTNVMQGSNDGGEEPYYFESLRNHYWTYMDLAKRLEAEIESVRRRGATAMPTVGVKRMRGCVA